MELLLRKNADYGGSVWQVPILAPHLSVYDAMLCRMSDKIARMINLSAKKSGEVDETTEETLRDFVGYGILKLSMPVAAKEADSNRAKVLAVHPGATANEDDDEDWMITDNNGDYLSGFFDTEAEAWADAASWVKD